MNKQLESEDWNKTWELEGKHQEEFFNNSYSFKRIKETISGLGFDIKTNQYNFCELGCGGGLWVKWINSFGIKVSGVDNSIVGLDLAKQRNKETDLRLKDVRNTSFEDNSFDLVFGLGLIEHFEDEEISKILLEAKRIIKQNGKIIISVPNRSKYSGLWCYESIKGRCPSERILEASHLKQLFELIGFKNIKVNYGGLFIPKIRNKKWFSKLNLKWFENSKTSDYIIISGEKI